MVSARTSSPIAVLPLALVTACGGAQRTDDPTNWGPPGCSAGACGAWTTNTIIECHCDADDFLLERISEDAGGAVYTEHYRPDDGDVVGEIDVDWDADGVADQREIRTIRGDDLVSVATDWDLDGTMDFMSESDTTDHEGYVSVYTRYDEDADGAWDYCDTADYAGDQMLSSGLDMDCDTAIEERYHYLDCWPPYLDCTLDPAVHGSGVVTDLSSYELTIPAESPGFDDIALHRQDFDQRPWAPATFGPCAEVPFPPATPDEVARTCDEAGRALVVHAVDETWWEPYYVRYRYDDAGRLVLREVSDPFAWHSTTEVLYDDAGRIAALVTAESAEPGLTLWRFAFDRHGRRTTVTQDFGDQSLVDLVCDCDCGPSDDALDCALSNCRHATE